MKGYCEECGKRRGLSEYGLCRECEGKLIEEGMRLWSDDEDVSDVVVEKVEEVRVGLRLKRRYV